MDYPKAFKHLDEALKIAEEANDFVSIVFACYYLGMALFFNCEFEKAHNYLKRSVDIATAAKNAWAISTNKSTVSMNNSINGRITLGYKDSDEALQIAEESGDIFPIAIANTSHGISYHFRGLLKEATKHILKGVDLYANINVVAWNAFAHLFLGETYFEIEEYQKAMNHYKQSSLILDHNRILPPQSNLSKMGVAKAAVMSGETDIKLESMFNDVHENKTKLYEGWMLRYIGEILLNIDDQHISEAEDWINKAIKADNENGMKWHLARDYALYAEWFKRKGEPSKAKENLNKAIEIFKECGADGWVERYEKELSALS